MGGLWGFQYITFKKTREKEGQSYIYGVPDMNLY